MDSEYTARLIQEWAGAVITVGIAVLVALLAGSGLVLFVQEMRDRFRARKTPP